MTHILDLHIPILVVINKIDTLNNLQKEKLLKAVEEHFGHKDRLFTIGISAKTGFNINKIRPIVNDLRARSHVALTTGQLNKTISRAFIAKPPTFPHNKVVKVYYTTQVKSYPPIFMCFINKKPNVTTAFQNWLESVVRKAGGWQGIPLHFLFKDKKMDEDGYAKHLEKRKQAIRARLKRTPKEKIEAKQKAIARATQKRGM
jgi:GTP-binding protein